MTRRRQGFGVDPRGMVLGVSVIAIPAMCVGLLIGRLVFG